MKHVVELTALMQKAKGKPQLRLLSVGMCPNVRITRLNVRSDYHIFNEIIQQRLVIKFQINISY